jgi:hypothetical protein
VSLLLLFGGASVSLPIVPITLLAGLTDPVLLGGLTDPVQVTGQIDPQTEA